MRNHNKPAWFRKSKEHDAAVGKCSKDASLGQGKRSKIVAIEKPVQLGSIHNAEDMDNLDPSLLFHDEDDDNKLQAMKEVDRELIMSRRFEQLKMIRDMNVALKAAEDKEKEKAAEIKEKETATDNNEEEVSVESVTAGAGAELSEKVSAESVTAGSGDESEKKPHSVVKVMQIEHSSPPTIQSPMIQMTEEELAMHDEAASVAQKVRENNDSSISGGTTVSLKETDFSINDEIYNDPLSKSYADIENGLEVLAHASASENKFCLAPCVICNSVTSNDYRCRHCGHHVHHFCAVPEGKEGHGNHYLCSIYCLGDTEPVTRSEGKIAVEGSDYGVAAGAVEGNNTEELDSDNFGK